MERADRHHESQLRNEANLRRTIDDDSERTEAADQKMIVISLIHSPNLFKMPFENASERVPYRIV